MKNSMIPVQSVCKALTLLDKVVAANLLRGGAGLSELSSECCMPLNTTHNLLKSLAASGYVSLRGRGVYVPGPKCDEIARMILAGRDSLRNQIVKELYALSWLMENGL